MNGYANTQTNTACRFAKNTTRILNLPRIFLKNDNDFLVERICKNEKQSFKN